MPAPDSKLTGSCPACGELNEPGMVYCMHCGVELAPPASQPSAAKTLPTCPSCGKTDEQSVRFCIYCGADLVPARRATRSLLTHTDELAAQVERSRGLSLQFKLSAAACLVGLLVGLAGGYLKLRSFFSDYVVRSGWPQAGIVVYASLPGAQVTVEELSGRNFTVGRLGATGTVAIPDLPPGSYRVTVSSPGYTSFSTQVEVERNRPAVIGYPVRIELSSRG